MNKKDKQTTNILKQQQQQKQFPFIDQCLRKHGEMSHLLKILHAASWQRHTLLATGIMGSVYYGNKQDVKVKVT